MTSKSGTPVGMYEGIQLDLKKQANYETAHRLAISRLAALDFRLQCRKAGAELVGGGIPLQARLKFLDRTILVTHPAGEVVTESGDDIPLWEKIITLHYLIHAQGASPSGDLVTYNDIPDGRLYYPNFVKRTSEILLPAYGQKPEALISAALKLGGLERPGLGDYAVVIPALPRVAYVFILWQGDEEFPPQVNVVFDRNISDYLPAEDITVLANMIAVKLVKAK
jgi:hypothetical protein